MADAKVAPPAGSEDAEVFLSASEDEAAPQMITPELLSALVKQVEFYFSDANLPTDKKLLKQIRKDPDGFVPVKLFANFRKVRALSKDVGIITEALRSATLLQLSEDGKRVKRIVPVPEYDISDIQRRTIVVENLPGNPSPTIESVTDMFRVYGRVKLVRICSRESKGKLPSWLTSSCQNMGGQQHAYVEFEEEEGAILASAALAQDCDAPDGVVQVRRLLACIAEQRERRSVTGAGSSFGGSSGGGSRKGSRDVSPMGSRRDASSRRGSGGGAPYGSGAYSCGGSTWTSSSTGGAAPDIYHPAFHTYRSYGGAYEHGGGSRTGSGGGAGPSPPMSFVPPPPPPPRRSCDSAPPSELLPAAAAMAPAPAAAAPPPSSGRALNVYRPPAKRLSDGYHGSFQPTSVGGAPAAVPPPTTVIPPPLLRCGGGSFGSSCGSSTTPVSAVSTPTAAPSSSPLGTTFINIVANSPPLSTRGASGGGAGRPPVHPPSMLLPPPPPPPKPQQQQQSAAIEAPTTITAAPSPAPVAAAPVLPSSALAEAIAQAQAERRASEAGASKTTTTDAMMAPVATAIAIITPIVQPAAAAGPAAAPRSVPTAPKFCLDLGAVAPTRGSRTSALPADVAAGQDSTVAAAKPAQASLPRGTQTQMVANVEDFINNILAGRPTPRPASSPSSGGAAPAAAHQQPRKAPLTVVPTPAAAAAAAAAAALGVSSAPRNPALSWQQQQQQQPSVDAAVAVAGILATTLRRPSTAAPAAAPTASGNAPAAKPAAATAVTASGEQAVASQQAIAMGPTAPAVYLTAVAPGEMAEHGVAAATDMAALEHAVMVTVTRSPAPAAVAAPAEYCVKPASLAAWTVPADAVPTAVAFITGIVSTSNSSPPTSPMLLSSKAGGITEGKGSGSKAAVGAPAAGARVQPGVKRLSRRDYAQWAAATPEFRAEAVSKYAGSSASGSPNTTTGGFGVGRGSGGGAGPAMGSGSCSPPTIATLSISDGGVFGTAVSSGPSYNSSGGGASGHYHVAPSSSTAAPIWHVAKGPDGSKGFAGRARMLAA